MMKTKLIPFLLLTLVLSIGATSCGKRQHIYLSKNKAIFTPAGGIRSIKVFSDNHWTLQTSGNHDWFTISPMEGGNEDIITITAGKYNEATDRSAIITIVSENGKVKKDIQIIQRRIDMTDLVNKFWFMYFYERWETDFYGEDIEDSHRTWEYYYGPEYTNWFFYFQEDSTGFLWKAKNNDTIYYAFNYIFYPLEDSLYINFETDSDTVEDYLTIVEELDNDNFVFQNEYKPHRFEKLHMGNATRMEKKMFAKPDRVMKKPHGPIIQLDD